LIENVVNRGQKGEIVKVKRGYFRNLLYPRKMAGNV
jgi:ribosomal protein L9